MSALQAPFPWFGGKRRVADLIWERFGDVENYVEPFFGSGAVLLGRPKNHAAKIETVNDLDGFVANFWRSVAADPIETAAWADWPIIEADLNARHAWLVSQRENLLRRLEGDPDYYDAKIAGWWVAGVCGWIGSGYCSGDGPWIVRDGELIDRRTDQPADPAPGQRGAGHQPEDLPDLSNAGQGINRQIPHLSNAGQGINRQIPHLGDAGRGINRQIPHLSNAGQGINRKIPHLGDETPIEAWFAALATRLRRTRVTNGSWERVVTDSVTIRHGLTGVFLDPPYGDEIEQTRVYATDSGTVASDVRDWCIESGNDKRLRIALCGYAGEGHDVLLDYGWTAHAWKTSGGYGGGRGGTGDANRHRERIYFSPACIADDEPDLLGLLGDAS